MASAQKRNSPMNRPISTLAADYAQDGFVFPVEIITDEEARALRDDLERAEAETAQDRHKLGMVRGYPARLLPSFDRLIRHPNMIAAASAVLGPDLMVWGSGLFIKEANTPSYVSWHQDLTYWGLDKVEEVTLWVALSPSTRESGCMRFVPGTHRTNIVPHRDSFAKDNLLTRGQELEVEVDEAQAVDVVLKPGQASVHHGHLFHASGPNSTGDRRIGAAIRYIAPSMKARSGPETQVSLVAGEDRFGHFTIVPGPTERLSEADFAAVSRDREIREQVLFDGAAAEGRRRK
jgi:ectoine hydroxylase-related dioxygenase (phytanoyl-CoA dioxygenase family)